MSLLSIFTPKSKSFPDFIEALKTGTDNVLHEIDLNENNFEVMPYSAILDNPGDIADGVNQVKLKTGLSIFGIFNSVLIKYYDSGEIAYYLYTVTREQTRILEFAKALFDQIDLGIYDSDKFYSFKQTDKVNDLANGRGDGKDIVNVWQTEKYSILLQYRNEPRNQFSVIIRRKIKREVNTDSRKGTIHDLLNIDLNKILQQEEVAQEVNRLDDGSINFIDYTFNLSRPVLDAFNHVTIRLFSSERRFATNIQTHVTLVSTIDVSLKTKVNVCEKILKIYGSDWTGDSDLSIGEIEMLERNETWVGRRWHLNEVHGLHLTGDNTSDVYWVEINNSVLENGFTLTVGCYNKLIEYFTAD